MQLINLADPDPVSNSVLFMYLLNLIVDILDFPNSYSYFCPCFPTQTSPTPVDLFVGPALFDASSISGAGVSSLVAGCSCKLHHTPAFAVLVRTSRATYHSVAKVVGTTKEQTAEAQTKERSSALSPPARPCCPFFSDDAVNNTI